MLKFWFKWKFYDSNNFKILDGLFWIVEYVWFFGEIFEVKFVGFILFISFEDSIIVYGV